MSRLLIAFLLLTLLAVYPPRVAAAESDLYGRWQLDVEKSDDVSEVIDEFLRNNKSKHKRSGGGPRVADTAGMSPVGKGGVDLLIANYLPRARLLVIAPVDNGIAIRCEGMEQRLINTSGKTASISAAGKPLDGNRDVAIAGWEKGNLYSEVTTEQGVHIFESFLLSGTSLIIETEFRYPVLEPLIVTRRFNKLPAE